MTNNDRMKFAENMAALSETFGNTEPSERKIELYFKALSDLTIEQIEQACISLVNTRTITSTFPVPAEIREAISGGQSAAILALDKAEKAAERYGAYVSVAFDDPVIHAVIQSLGGWPKFCRNDDGREWHWIQKEFIKLYETFAKHPRPDIPLVLTGICDLENSSAGRVEWLKGAKLIGSAEAVRSWQEKLTGTRPSLPEVKREDNTGAGTSQSLARS